MGLRGSWSHANSGSRSAFNRCPLCASRAAACQHSALANNPPLEGRPLPLQGAESGEAQSWEGEACCCREWAQRYRKPSLGGGAGIWFHEEGGGNLGRHSSAQHTATSIQSSKTHASRRAPKGGHSVEWEWGSGPALIMPSRSSGTQLYSALAASDLGL